MSVKNVIQQWNNTAERYTNEQEKSEYTENNKRIVKERFQDLSGQKILDLGCGYGYYTDYFAGIGADVSGVDGSDKMIEIARSYYPDCSFAVCDITEKLPFSDNSFDLIFCNQVLMDVEDVESVFSECYRILKTHGIFYYSIVHPAFYDCHWVKDENDFLFAKQISSYIKPYSFLNDFWGETMHFHRPLSYYLNAASEQGFILKHIDEPVSYDGITKNQDLPLFLFAEYQKGKLR